MLTKKYKNFYERNGYLVVHNLIPKKKINKFNLFFQNNVIKKKKTVFPLMDKQKVDRIKIIDNKLQNPIANIHSIKYFEKKFSKLNEESLKIILYKNISKVLSMLYDYKKFNLVMSMLFDQNAGTPAHQDCYYLDSKPHGKMTAAWIALEDIDKKAGRFYVIPGSHKTNIQLNKNEIKDPNKYEKKLINVINKKKMKIKAPILKKGSVLFWNSGTIHGSLKTIDKKYSRKSFTCHFIPTKYKFLRNRYLNEVRPIKRFNNNINNNIFCRLIKVNQKNKKKYISRSVKNFNKQNFKNIQ